MTNSEAHALLTAEGIPAKILDDTHIMATGITAAMKCHPDKIERARQESARWIEVREANKATFAAMKTDRPIVELTPEQEAKKAAFIAWEASSPTATGKLSGQSVAEKARIAKNNKWIAEHNS